MLARRLIEKGVRFVQLFNGAYAMGEGVGNWDGHKAIKQQYGIHGPILDQPVAGLLRDLKQRGLLSDTLVAFVTEFGRMPTFQKGANGRDHNPAGFTVWLAGAGVKRAAVSGSGIFKDQTSDSTVRAAFFDGAILDWQVLIPDFGTVTGKMQVTALEYFGQYNGEVMFDLALESAGQLTFGAV